MTGAVEATTPEVVAEPTLGARRGPHAKPQAPIDTPIDMPIDMPIDTPISLASAIRHLVM